MVGGLCHNSLFNRIAKLLYLSYNSLYKLATVIKCLYAKIFKPA